MKNIISRQRTYFNTHKTKEVPFRVAQLKKLKKVLQQNESLLYEAIYADFKKSKFDTYTTELALIYHDIDDALKNCYQWSRKQKVKTNLVNFPATSYIIPQPLGVALVIGAWNYPYQLSLAPMVAAMAAGCTVVVKPSEIPSRTSTVIHKVISENFSPQYLAVIEGGIPETTELLEQKFDKIFFTGSTPVGKIIYKAAAQQLTPVTLELGGKSPVFVTEKSNLKMAAKRIVWGKFLNAGQTCIAPDYAYVHESIKDEFLKLLKAEITKENFSVENGNYVQIINKKNVKRLTELIIPEKIYYGGKISEQDRIIEPTVLYNITFKDSVMQEEIFGPILPVLSYRDLDTAISNVHQLPHPLSCYVFTKSKKEQQKVLNQIIFGGGGVNETVMHIANGNLPFGGVGNSGLGSYHGKAGFSAFTHYKSIIEKPTFFELPLKYFPHTQNKFWWIKQFFKF